MKDKFPGHFSTPEAKENLWQKCIFVFDTNILLNLYRYSDETRALFVKSLEGLRDRIWIPYKVAAEYLENRLDVIYEQQEEYEKAITDIKKLKGKLENSRQHPFVSLNAMKAVSESLDSAITELNKNKEIHSDRISKDEIKELIAEIFNDRVGSSTPNDVLENIILEGADRYKQKTPPGYSDIKKQSSEESLTARCRPYGDLIIWKAILEKAKHDNLPVIFITDDGKEDWWLRFKGKTLGPRPELIEEFKKEVNQEFYMYLPERFLSLANEKAQKDLSKEVIDEIRDIRSKEQENLQAITAPTESQLNKSGLYYKYGKKKFLKGSEHIDIAATAAWEYENIGHLQREIAALDDRIAQLLSESESLEQRGMDYLHQDPEATEESNEYLEMKAQYIHCKEKIAYYKSLIAAYRGKLNILYNRRNPEPPF